MLIFYKLLYETCETWKTEYTQFNNNRGDIMYSDGTQYIQPSTSRNYCCTFLEYSGDFRYTLKTTGRLGICFSGMRNQSDTMSWDYFIQLEAGCFLISWENGYTRLASTSQPSSSTQILTKQNGLLNWQIYNQNDTLILDYTCSATSDYAKNLKYLGVVNATGGASSIQEILVEAL